MRNERYSTDLTDAAWALIALQNVATGEWCIVAESDLLDQFSRNELSFVVAVDECSRDVSSSLSDKLRRDLSLHPPNLVELARTRIQYLKEIDRREPISITQATIEPLTRAVAERVNDSKPPGWRTVCRDYHNWVAAGRDIRAIVPRHTDKGGSGPRMIPEVKGISDQVIQELYMTAERKRVPEVHLEIVRRLSDANKFRPEAEGLPIPSRSTIYREIKRMPPYEVMVARYGKHRAEMKFRVSGAGPEISRALQRVSMDHTPSDIIVVDDSTMLPLGRPTITSALVEHTMSHGLLRGFRTAELPVRDEVPQTCDPSQDLCAA